MFQFYRALLLLLIMAALANAQGLDADIRQLETDLKNFKYQEVLQKGSFLLEEGYLSEADSLRIYTYMLNAAYKLEDQDQVRQIMIRIVDCNRDYALDARLNSPKIIEDFNSFKKRYLADLNTTVPDDSLKVQDQLPPEPRITPYQAMASVAVPGTGHLLQKKNLKAYAYSGISVLFLTGIAYSSYKSDLYHDEYMSAGENANHDHLYDKYNRMYKLKNSLITGYSIYALYVLYDLLNLPSHQKIKISPKITSFHKGLGIHFSW